MAESEYGPGLSDCRTCALRFLLPKLWMMETKLQRKRQNGKGKKRKEGKRKGDFPGGPVVKTPACQCRKCRFEATTVRNLCSAMREESRPARTRES